jgi:hypothetical protein
LEALLFAVEGESNDSNAGDGQVAREIYPRAGYRQDAGATSDLPSGCFRRTIVRLVAPREGEMVANFGNSRMGRVFPDVEPEPSALVDDLLESIRGFGAREIDLPAFQGRVLAALIRARSAATLRRHLTRALSQKTDQPLARKTWPERDYTVQILYIRPHEVHPCHCHHNVVSTQMVLAGRVFGREYERVRRRADGMLLLRPLSERWLAPGDYLQASEMSRNVHWFAAGDEPTAMFNLNIRGFERDTFDPRDGRLLGRRLLDSTLGADQGLVVAREIAVAEAYERFGARPLTDFPFPVAEANATRDSALGTIAQSRT